MNIEQELFRAMDLSDEEQYAEAVALFTEILKHSPDYDRAFFERAMAYLNLDKDHLALADFKRLLEINPTYPGGKDWHSRTLAGLGDFKSSAEMKLSELRELPDGKYGMGVSPQSWADCIGNFYKAGEMQKAESLLEEYFEKHQAKVADYKVYETAPLRWYARILIDTGRYALALEKATQAMASEHKVPADHELFIEANIYLKNWEIAREAIDHYVDKIHDGYETDRILEMKKMLE